MNRPAKSLIEAIANGILTVAMRDIKVTAYDSIHDYIENKCLAAQAKAKEAGDDKTFYAIQDLYMELTRIN